MHFWSLLLTFHNDSSSCWSSLLSAEWSFPSRTDNDWRSKSILSNGWNWPVCIIPKVWSTHAWVYFILQLIYDAHLGRSQNHVWGCSWPRNDCDLELVGLKEGCWIIYCFLSSLLRSRFPGFGYSNLSFDIHFAKVAYRFQWSDLCLWNLISSKCLDFWCYP